MLEKKKILFLVEALSCGIFTYIVDLANGLVDSFDIYIVHAIRPQTPKNYKDYFDKRVKLIKVENLRREIKPAQELKAIKEVREIAEQIKPDIIHLHSTKAGAIGRLAFNGKNVPLFYTPHGYSFLIQNYSPLKRMVFKGIEAILAKRNCTTISCGLGEHKETLKFTKNATYINNAINVEELEKSLSGMKKEDHPFTVFTLGRISYQKNPALFNKIAEKMPDTKFLWVGDGELKNELTSKNIEITGWVTREDALNASVNADVFLLTSLWEGLPISLLESMYMKKLCVVSNVIGNRDVIKNGENGFVCDSLDEFVDAINSNSKELVDKAYQDLITEYNTKEQIKRYAEIYRNAVK